MHSVTHNTNLEASRNGVNEGRQRLRKEGVSLSDCVVNTASDIGFRPAGENFQKCVCCHLPLETGACRCRLDCRTRRISAYSLKMSPLSLKGTMNWTILTGTSETTEYPHPTSPSNTPNNALSSFHLPDIELKSLFSYPPGVGGWQESTLVTEVGRQLPSISFHQHAGAPHVCICVSTRLGAASASSSFARHPKQSRLPSLAVSQQSTLFIRSSSPTNFHYAGEDE